MCVSLLTLGQKEKKKKKHEKRETRIFRNCEAALFVVSKLHSNEIRGKYILSQLESVAKISNLQYIEVLQSYGNPNTLKCFNILKCFNLMKVTIGLQHFNMTFATNR